MPLVALVLHWCCIGVALITIGGYFYLIRLTFVWIFDIPADRCLRIDLSNVTHGAAVASQRGGWQQDSPGSGSGWIQKSVIFYPSGPAGPADLVRPQYGCSERSNLAPKDSQGHL